MRKLLVIAALLAAACGSQRAAPESTLPAGHVVLATFTVDVDLAAGTFVVRTTPRAPGIPARSGSLVNLDADVTVANSIGPWIGTPTPACTSGSSPTTWGAGVTVKNNLPGTYLSGVYAEITTFPPGMTGRESCSNATAPTGLDATYGLWSYGTIAPGATSSAASWIFKFVSASTFSFSGRIVGVKADPANVGGDVQRLVASDKLNVIGDSGTSVVVAGRPSGIDFVNSTSGLYEQNVATSAAATAIAVAPTRIWWGSAASSESFVLGWMDLAGSIHASEIITPSGSAIGSGFVHTLVPDATSPDTKVWIVYYNNVSSTLIWSYDIDSGLGARSRAHPVRLRWEPMAGSTCPCRPGLRISSSHSPSRRTRRRRKHRSIRALGARAPTPSSAAPTRSSTSDADPGGWRR